MDNFLIRCVLVIGAVFCAFQMYLFWIKPQGYIDFMRRWPVVFRLDSAQDGTLRIWVGRIISLIAFAVIVVVAVSSFGQ